MKWLGSPVHKAEQGALLCKNEMNGLQYTQSDLADYSNILLKPKYSEQGHMQKLLKGTTSIRCNDEDSRHVLKH